MFLPRKYSGTSVRAGRKKGRFDWALGPSRKVVELEDLTGHFSDIDLLGADVKGRKIAYRQQ